MTSKTVFQQEEEHVDTIWITKTEKFNEQKKKVRLRELFSEQISTSGRSGCDRGNRDNENRDYNQDEEGPDHSSFCLLFDSMSTISKQDLRLLSKRLEEFADVVATTTKTTQASKTPPICCCCLEFDRCNFLDNGALEELETLIRTFGGRKVLDSETSPGNINKQLLLRNKNSIIIESLNFSSKSLSLRECVSIVSAAEGSLERVSIELQSGHLSTYIEKITNADDELNLKTITCKTGATWENQVGTKTHLLPQIVVPNGLDVTICSVHPGVSELLDTNVMQEIRETVLQLPNLISLSLGPISLDKESLRLLITAMTESKSSHVMRRFLLSLSGGLTEGSDALPLLNDLLIMISTKTTISRIQLFLEDIPLLLTNNPPAAVRQFVKTLRASPIDILELENVGLDESSFVTVFQAASGMRKLGEEAQHIWLNGRGFLGEKGFDQILSTIPVMENFQTVSLVDSEPPAPSPFLSSNHEDKLEDGLNRSLIKALKRNTSLQYFNIEAGSVFFPSCERDWSELFVIWKRNEALALARKLVVAPPASAAPRGLWPHAMEKLVAIAASGEEEEHEGCHHGGDAVYLVMQSLASDLLLL